MITFIILLYLIGSIYSSNSDDSLPVYLRGMKWNEVEKQLKKDLCLQDDYVPLNYAIDLSVNVRGHAGAEKSDFNGTVTIDFEMVKPSDSIELHSNGLIIEKAILVNSLIMDKPAEVMKITSNLERETINIHANRTINAGETYILQITYRGIAKMDEYGLYESWDPKLNKSLDSNGPFILASNNIPTGARFWFPCYDEPSKRATFQLQVNHPSRLNVYSNTNVKRTESIINGRTLTVFHETDSLSTYQIALSVNHLARQSIDVKGFGQVQLISSANSHEYYSKKENNLPQPFNVKVNIASFLKRSLELLGNTTLPIPTNKLDIIILEGTHLHSVHPGLVTIGRFNFWDLPNYINAVHENKTLTRLVTGPQIFLRNTEQMWLQEALSNYLINKTDIEVFQLDRVPDHLLYASLHERSLQEQVTHTSTTKQYLTSKNSIRSEKALHVLKLLARLCPESQLDIRKYINDQNGAFIDVELFISAITTSCRDSVIAREFLKDFLNQPGKALLIVKRFNGSVEITQTRYHSTYFDAGLRDNKTRYTIPIPYEIDGNQHIQVFRKDDTSLSFSVPDSSYFLIDHSFDHLYFVYYETPLFVLKRNYTEHERIKLYAAVQKSIIAAYNIGYANYDQLFEKLQHFARNGLFKYHSDVAVGASTLHLHSESGKNRTNWYAILGSVSTAVMAQSHYDECDESRSNVYGFNYWQASWNAMFNNETMYWAAPLDYKFRVSLNGHCANEWRNVTVYRKFLEDNFLGETTVIRPNLMSGLSRRSWNYDQWRELHRFFFRHAANSTDHRFDLLAETVLNQVYMDVNGGPIPHMDIRQDYLDQLRNFVIRHPHRAASMSTEIAMKLEREYARCGLHDFQAASGRTYQNNDVVELRAMFKEHNNFE